MMLRLQRAWFGSASMPTEASDNVEMFLDSHNRVHVRTDFQGKIAISMMLNAREVVPMNDAPYEQSYSALLDSETHCAPMPSLPAEPSTPFSDNEPTTIVKAPLDAVTKLTRDEKPVFSAISKPKGRK